MSKRELSISEQCQKMILQVHQDDMSEAFGHITKEQRAEPLLSSEGLCRASRERNKIKETSAQVKQRVQAELNESFGNVRAGFRTGDLIINTEVPKPVTKKDISKQVNNLKETLDRYYMVDSDGNIK